MYVDKYWDQFEAIEDYWHYTAMVAYTVMFVVGVPANIAVIVYYLKNMKNRKSYNYLLVNLMVADLFCLSNAPIVVYNSIYGTWMLGQVACNIYGVCGGLFGFVSIATMTMISIERYLVVKYPLKVLDTDKKMSAFVIVASWLYGCTWCLLPLFTSNGYVPEGFLTSCTFDFLNRDTQSVTIIALMVLFGFSLPVLTTALFYILISVHIREHYSKLKKRHDIDMSHISRVRVARAQKSQVVSKLRIEEDLTTTISQVTESNQTQSTAKPNKIKLTAEMRLIRSSIVIVVMFCVSWSPYAVISLLAQHSPNRSKYVTPSTVALPTIFAKLSAVTNPIIYAFTNQDFLLSMKKRLKCQ
jgi:r-opsin